MSKSVRATFVATSLSRGEDKEHWTPPGKFPYCWPAARRTRSTSPVAGSKIGRSSTKGERQLWVR